MKRTTFALARPTHIGGRVVEVGTTVAVVESEFAYDSIFSLASQMGLVEVTSAKMEEPTPEPEETQADDAEVGGVDVVAEPPVIEVPAEITGGTPLSDTEMSEALQTRLEINGITTVEQLGEFIASGADLVDLEDIGTTYAKRILGWYNSRNS